MEEREINNWTEMAALAQQYQKRDWIFRGVPWHRHKLVPKIGRRHTTVQLKTSGAFAGFEPKAFGMKPFGGTKLEWEPVEVPDFEAAQELRLFEDFRRAARPHVRFIPDTDMDWLVLAQHHGLATRLLDWTESPLIASFFAIRNGPSPDIPKSTKFEEMLVEGRAAIYGLPTPDPINERSFQTTEDLFEVGDGDPRMVRPAHFTARVTVQRAVLTYHSNPYVPWEPEGMIKWIFSPMLDLGTNLRDILDKCGINEAALFPDLDGIASYLTARYRAF